MMQQDDLYIDNENFIQYDITVFLSELCSNQDLIYDTLIGHDNLQ